jgi:hypothetical protein
MNYMQKGQEGTNVKACYEFGNDPRKCVLNKKQEWRLTIKLKIILLLFYQVDFDF